jgi:hypothetical protein
MIEATETAVKIDGRKWPRKDRPMNKRKGRGLSDREQAIMNEAFMTGRVYAIGGEKETPMEIHNRLTANCERVAGKPKPPARKVRPKFKAIYGHGYGGVYLKSEVDAWLSKWAGGGEVAVNRPERCGVCPLFYICLIAGNPQDRRCPEAWRRLTAWAGRGKE